MVYTCFLCDVVHTCDAHDSNYLWAATNKQGDSNSKVIICFALNLRYQQIVYSY